MKKKRAETDRQPLGICLPLLVLMAASLMWGCLPLPILDAMGVVRGSALDPSNRMHLVVENDRGITYGVVNGLWLNPETVTTSGTLGRTSGHPMGTGRGVLALDPEGRPHVLFFSNAGTGWPATPELYGALIHSWKQAGAWESETVGVVDDCVLASQPAIAIDDHGGIHVSYSVMGCDSGDVEVRYAEKQDGLWSEEVIDSFAGLGLGPYPVLLSRIALGPDQEPVIAAGAGGWSYELHCSDAVVRVAQPAEGGGWDMDEIYSFLDPCYPRGLNGKINDLSLALGPGGEKAVGLIFQTSEWSYVSTTYSITVQMGSEWVVDPLCSQSGGEFGAPLDCQAGDIAFDGAGRLHAMFTREDFDGPPPDSPVEQSIYMARRSDTGWEEELLWDNSLYGVAAEYEYLPQLHFSTSSQAKILYNNGRTLMLLFN